MTLALGGIDLPARVASIFEEDELPPALAWVDGLSPLHQRLFYFDIAGLVSRALLAALTRQARRLDDDLTRQLESNLDDLLASWKATAEVDSDPALAEQLVRPTESKRYREWTAD